MGSIPKETKLFQPLKLGKTQLNHRIALAPLTRVRNDDDHSPVPFMAKYYADRGSTPGTLVIAEATAIARKEAGQKYTPSFESDRQVEGWSKIIDAVHANGSVFFQQLWSLGRAASAEYLEGQGYPFKSSSAVPMKEGGAVPKEMTEEDIWDVINGFAEAAKRVVAAGGDGVEIHGAHGYLIDQFTEDSINKRTDKWGGPIENRARFLLEVVKAVVAAVGAERVALRLSPYATFQGAETTDIEGDFTYIVKELKKLNEPFAYLSLVEARGDPAKLFVEESESGHPQTLDFILEAWDNTSPVVVAGGYTAESAKLAVDEHYKKWDVIIAFGRPFISNPDLVYRVKHDIPFAKPDRSTFYIPGTEKGYNDYPFSEEYLQSLTSNKL